MMHGNPFYCADHAEKIIALEELVGSERDIQDVLDDISDGCGGCERLGYSNESGGMDWITVLTDEGQRVHYAMLTVDQGAITATIYGSWLITHGSQDSVTTYARCMTEFHDYYAQENDE